MSSILQRMFHFFCCDVGGRWYFRVKLTALHNVLTLRRLLYFKCNKKSAITDFFLTRYFLLEAASLYSIVFFFLRKDFLFARCFLNTFAAFSQSWILYVPRHEAKRRNWKHPSSVRLSCELDNLKNIWGTDIHYGVRLHLGTISWSGSGIW